MSQVAIALGLILARVGVWSGLAWQVVVAASLLTLIKGLGTHRALTILALTLTLGLILGVQGALLLTMVGGLGTHGPGRTGPGPRVGPAAASGAGPGEG